jgi:hypothetical protein
MQEGVMYNKSAKLQFLKQLTQFEPTCLHLGFLGTHSSVRVYTLPGLH